MIIPMKYLFIILLISSCNALTLLSNKTSRVDEGFEEDELNEQYDNLVCPGGYSKVSGSSSFGTNTFCVMRFEAKNVSGVAKSQPELTPWFGTGVDLSGAKAICQSLGTGYDLISNPEWMTIAAEIELNGNNWDSGSVGTGCIVRGNSGDTAGNCGYNNAGNIDFGPTTGRNVKARHFLANGQEVWDLSGNVQEWVDWTLGGSADTGPTICTGSDIELNAVSCGGLTAIDYQPQDPTLDSTRGAGKFFGGTGGGIIRGGSYLNLATTGIYRLTTNSLPTNTTSVIGFRCVYRGDQ